MSIPRLLTTAVRARPCLVGSLQAQKHQSRRIATAISASVLDIPPPDLPIATPAAKKTRAKSTATKQKVVKAVKVEVDDVLPPPKAVRKTTAKSATTKSATTKTTRTRKAAVIAPTDVEAPVEKAPVKKRVTKKSTVAANGTIVTAANSKVASSSKGTSATTADAIVAADSSIATLATESPQSQVLEPVNTKEISEAQAVTISPQPIPAVSQVSSKKISEPKSPRTESLAKSSTPVAAKKAVIPKQAVTAPSQAPPQTSKNEKSGFEFVDDDNADTPEARLRRGQTASEHVAMGGKLPKRYRGAARRVLAIIVALPFVIVGTPLVYERVIEGKGPKTRPTSQVLAAEQTQTAELAADGAVSELVADSRNV